MRRLLCLWLVWSTCSPAASAATLTLVVVKLPASTPADATLTLGANVGGFDSRYRTLADPAHTGVARLPSILEWFAAGR